MKIIILLLLGMTCLSLTGCTTAGPFVMNISSDGDGGLVIEKAFVEMNGFTGAVSTKNPSTSTIYLYPSSKRKNKAQNTNE